MSIEKITEQLKREITAHRQQERETLERIAAITSVDFADQAAGELDHRKQHYNMEIYLELLSRLETIIRAGMPNCVAIEATQTGESTETILEVWRNCNFSRR